MKKVIILRKIHVKIKSFAPPYKETKHIHVSAANRKSRPMQMWTLQKRSKKTRLSLLRGGCNAYCLC